MKRETIKKRLAPVLKKDGTPTVKLENSVYYLSRLSLGDKVHFLAWTRNRGHHQIFGRERMDYVTNVLDLLKVKYSVGNDAPKGGLTGVYVEVERKHTKKLMEAIATIQNWDDEPLHEAI